MLEYLALKVFQRWFLGLHDVVIIIKKKSVIFTCEMIVFELWLK